MIRTRCYRSGNLEQADFDPAQISEFLDEPDSVVWLDLCEPDLKDLDLLAEEFGLNQLAVDDAMGGRQRAKLDRYGDHIFLSIYSAHLETESGELTVTELSVFAAPRYLITVRKTAGFPMDTVAQRWDNSGDLAKHGVGFLLHGLLDVVVDGHFDVVQQLDDEIEELEDLLFDPRPRSREVQMRSFEIRKSLLLLRRIVLPMREVITPLVRREIGVVDEEMVPYYQDVYDHVLRASEWTEGLRDLVATLVDTNLSIQSNRINVVMKKVTSYAALFAVPTAVSGYYGMNVRIWPGAGTVLGGVVAIALMLGLSAMLYVAFRKNDWL